jgi:hypothetical protein
MDPPCVNYIIIIGSQFWSNDDRRVAGTSIFPAITTAWLFSSCDVGRWTDASAGG